MRFHPIQRLRANLRERFFRFLRRAILHPRGKASVAEALQGLLAVRHPSVHGVRNGDVPYVDLNHSNGQVRACERDDLVFITGRFRTGSTFLWNVFRQLPEFTCYYEPFNERQRFKAAPSAPERIDPSHRHVSDTCREYVGLEELGRFYREDWIGRNLYMDATSWEPAMKAFVERLAERAAGRPLLQFNRIDFRLPWFRHNFPRAKVVHIYRHPRDQWCSTLMNLDRFGPESGGLKDFAPADGFYLRLWVDDLKFHFPFLADEGAHPYRHFYWLWKLSYLFGRRWADRSVCFEDLVKNPAAELKALFDFLQVGVRDWSPIEAVIEGPTLGTWRRYADDAWFRVHEKECERVLSDFLAAP